MRFSYETAGSCATRIDIEIEAGFIVSVDFIDGCAGNALAVSALVKGMPVAEAVRRLKGIACQGDTSCPDQLARALETAEMKYGPVASPSLSGISSAHEVLND